MDVRKKAYHILMDICIHKKYSHLVVKESLKKVNMKDKGLISNIVYGTLQNYRLLTYQWASFCEKPLKKEMELLMNMSVYQLLFLDRVPNYAVVNDAVEIAKGKYDGKFEKLINALLRKSIKQGIRKIESSDDEKLSIETSMPLWIVKMWNKQYGESVSAKLCRDSLLTPTQSLRVNTIKTSKKELLSISGLYREGLLGKDALLFCGKGSVAATNTHFRDGKISIQDEASQLVAPFLDPQKDEYILDMCAAPGSKTGHIAALMKNTGKIIALDLHAHRVDLIKASMRRLGCIHVDAFLLDATQVSKHYEVASFDRVLLDAPCSGYGVLKRKGDIKFHMKSEDMDGIIETQASLLEEGAKMVKPKGIFVYSTCTLNKKENEQQIAKFLSKHGEYCLLEEKTIFPYEHNCDGFYMAKMQNIQDKTIQRKIKMI
ncbi:MAG: 16S rRNA (cytosine(967)-C(5))-methyltransferase RsmB [Breznakia sp.]